MTPTENNPSPPLAQPGEVLGGKYRLEVVIGRGGMGEVWRAAHVRLGTKAAVKLIGANHAASAEVRKRFHNEAQAAARLASKHVVQVFDTGEREDGSPFIAMELLRGESLDQRIQRGVVPPFEVARILSQVCRALTRAHAAGIVHRDIKPENVFLSRTEDEDEPVVKLLDFGVAKLTDDMEATGSTRAGALIGTPLYMSPEQARAKKQIDGRSDTYSVGIVTYFLLTGKVPFSGQTVPDLLIEICRGVLPRITDNAPQPLPPAVDAWFHKACAELPSQRFDTAQALAEAFATAVGVPLPSRSGPSLPGDWVPESAPQVAANPVVKQSQVPTVIGTSTSISTDVRPPARRIVVAASVVVALALAGGFVALRSGGSDGASATAPSARGSPAPPAVASSVASEPAASPPQPTTAVEVAATAAPTSVPAEAPSAIPAAATVPKRVFSPPPKRRATPAAPHVDLGY